MLKAFEQIFGLTQLKHYLPGRKQAMFDFGFKLFFF